MPVKFKMSDKADSTLTLTAAKKYVRDLFGLDDTVDVTVQLNSTTLKREGVVVVLPFGIPQIKNEAPSVKKGWYELQAMVGASSAHPVKDDFSQKTVAYSTPMEATPTDYSDMTDEMWVEAVVKELFPGTIALHTAKSLYQPVHGTSGGSVYRVCFIGPELRVATRIKGHKVSFRATTVNNEAPKGAARVAFERLGVTTDHGDRLTCHATMSGPYNEENAHEYRALYGAYYAALRPWITTPFPAIGQLKGK